MIHDILLETIMHLPVYFNELYQVEWDICLTSKTNSISSMTEFYIGCITCKSHFITSFQRLNVLSARFYCNVSQLMHIQQINISQFYACCYKPTQSNQEHFNQTAIYVAVLKDQLISKADFIKRAQNVYGFLCLNKIGHMVFL